MVDSCANPRCSKPLHYLRDGRIFIFDVASARLGPDGRPVRHVEHYWLCGTCATSMVVDCCPEAGISVQAKPVGRSVTQGMSVA